MYPTTSELLVFCCVVGVIGWAVIEAAWWVLSHISIAWG